MEDLLTTDAPVESDPTSGRFAAIHPLLFAAYPVLFLWSQNLGETDPRDVIIPLVTFVAIAAAATWLLGAVLGDRRRAALVVTPLLIGLLMYGHVATLLGGIRIPGIVQQAGWVALCVIGIVAALRLGARRLATVDTILDRMAAILIVVTLVLIVPFQATAIGRGPTAVVEPRPDTTTAQKRDVYWLIFDRYGSDRAYEQLSGIENDLTAWLRDEGFTVLDKSHANYVRTGVSIPTTMNMAHLQDIAGLPGPDSTDLRPVQGLMQSSLVARQFKTLGYRYYHIGSSWSPNANDEAADVNLNVPGPSDFVSALYDESAGPAVIKRLRLEKVIDDPRDRHYKHNVYGLDAIEGLRDEAGPKFVFGHVLLPHPPRVFDLDGTFIEDAEALKLGGPEMYRRQLAYTNARIKGILTDLQSLPEDRRPIIILQADEGPWPASYVTGRTTDADWPANASEKELEQKYGILNAWYLPGGEDLGLYPSMTAINTFPTLFSRYFGLDYELLPDRIYSSSDWSHPYDLTDITDRLPSLR